MIRLTAAAPTTVASAAAGIRITVNASLTGTITVTDNLGVQAVITNPVVGNFFIYFGFTGPIVVAPSAVTDITISILSAARS